MSDVPLRKKYVLTQGNAGATDAVLDVSCPDGMLEVDVLMVGPDTPLTGRTVTAVLMSGAATVAALIANAGVSVTTGTKLPLLPGRMMTAAPAVDDALQNQRQFRLYAGDKVRIKAASLLQNETLTVTMRARLVDGGSTPTAASVSAGVTLVESTA